MSRRFVNLLVILAFLLGTPSIALAQDGTAPVPPVPDVTGLAVPDGEIIPVEVAPELVKANGPVQVVVRMADDPLAVAVGENVKQGNAFKLNHNQQRDYLGKLGQKQDTLLGQIGSLGGRGLGRLSKSINAVIVDVDASQIPAIAKLPNVIAIHPVINYTVDLSETVPYIGASALQMKGIDGAGVRVAVLDSGIDYIHKNLGGSGSVDEYNANNPDIIEPGTFPTWKVVGGYDFVGSTWDGAAVTTLSPDPDPLDWGPGAGHGTHVADIIAGKSLDGTHVGTAPGASLYAVKVCSSVSTACSGVALLQGMEFALDPNGDGDISDAVDVVNMSLGSNYGQYEDDLSAASTNAVKMGVVVVAAAGNAADRPYIVSSPSTAPGVISVAQTQVPSAKLYRIVAGSVTAGGNWQPWSAAPTLVSGPLAYDTTSAATRLGCADANGANPPTWTPGLFAGKILLVDRGTCAVSWKVANGAAAGALAVIVANNASQAPGDLPPDFSYGGGNVTVAGYTITRADGALLKTVLGQTATIDPATAAGLVMNMVASSARGPSYSYNSIKPDIGAPGASVSAIYGTGTEETAFGGTSGATPMVSGSAALLIQKFKWILPFEVKTRLMNTGETNIGLNPVALPGVLAPITRIGGGEVRVDQAAAATTEAWDALAFTGSLSFGHNWVNKTTTYTKLVAVRNLSAKTRTYTVTPTFRYANDEASGAVKISAPSAITVPAMGVKTFFVKVTVNPLKLPYWALNGGPFGGDGYRLQDYEFDGYVNVADAKDNIHLAWQILPQRGANLAAKPAVALKNGVGTLTLTNFGAAENGMADVFSLLGASPAIPLSQYPKAGDNFAIIDLKSFGARLVGIGGGQYGIQFAMNTFDLRTVPAYPAEFDVYLDVNMDGTDDFVLFNAENGGFGVSGQDIVYVYNLATGSASAYYYVDADFNSSNMIFTAPLGALGMTPGTQFNVSVYAFDNYFTGNLTDSITGMTYTAGAPKYAVDNYSPVVPQGGTLKLAVSAVPGGDTASPSQTGLLLLYRDTIPGRMADTVLVK